MRRIKLTPDVVLQKYINDLVLLFYISGYIGQERNLGIWEFKEIVGNSLKNNL